MAVAVSALEHGGVVGAQKVKYATVTFDSSYPTGGEPLTPSDFDLVSIDWIQTQDGVGYALYYDRTNSKLLAYYGNFDAADGPLIQVPNATDLSAVAVKVVVFGK